MTSSDGVSNEAASTPFALEGNGPTFLSAVSAGPGERRIALAFLLLSIAIFLGVAPFAKMPLAPMPSFIAIYETALVITDLVTAVFLFTQFDSAQSRAIPVLASGYLFTACLAIAHALSFPGLFSASGLLGAGPQTTAWLYMFWHAGFPIFVIAYAAIDQRSLKGKRSVARDSFVPLISIGSVILAAALVLLATQGHDLLPVLLQDGRYTVAMTVVQSSIWFWSPLALILLWRRRPHSVLNLWLMVVMCAWFFDVTLSTIINAGRFDLGFYAGRVYGLVANGFVLAMLMLESGKVYARLIMMHNSERRRVAELAASDPLTGIANRRAFEEALGSEWRRMRRYRTPLCLLMIDVDNFKSFNDVYGHVAGDQCLRAVAKVLADNSRRAGQMAARYGGEEFAVLLPHLHIDEAHRLAQRICEEVRALQILHKESAAAVHVTISAGVASALLVLGSEPGAMLSPRGDSSAGTRDLGPTLLVEAADRALYAAKNGGRNRVCTASSDIRVRPAKKQSAA
jgi:diguanylate cyclase (GGDEF)-like protein